MVKKEIMKERKNGMANSILGQKSGHGESMAELSTSDSFASH